jgi:type 1 glutamine amidotransferase
MRRLMFVAAFGFAAAILSSAVGQAPPKAANPMQVEKAEKALPTEAPAKPKKQRNLLVFSNTAGFRHSSIELGARVLTLMGDKTGAFTVTHTEDPSMIDAEKLKKFDAVFMLNTTNDCFRTPMPKGAKETPEQKAENDKVEAARKAALYEFVQNGGGLAGCHAATDTYKGWKEYNQMMGGAFVSHPWHKVVPIKIMDAKNPINAAFDGKDFEINDEIYMFRDDTALASDRKFLLVMDTSKMSKEDADKGKRKDGTYPISWVNTSGKGRVFYCSLGHREEIYWNPTILKHYLAGIQYALGDLEADATPTSPSTSGK